MISLLKYVSRWGVICLACMLLTACNTRNVQPEKPVEAVGIKSIAVLPFQDITKIYGVNVNARSYLSGHVMMTGYVPDSALPYLTSTLVSLLQTSGKYTILSSEGYQDILSGTVPDSDTASDSLKQYVKAGKQIGADAVLVGHVFRFIDRQGNRIAVEHPASVAFDLSLIDVAAGRLIWSDRFDETQKSLSENILDFNTFMHRKGSWITAEELAKEGLEAILRRFPKP